MRMTRRYTWLLYWLLAGCAGEPLSVGELRCTGERVRCVQSNALETSQDVVHTQPPTELETQFVWTAELPCAAKNCTAIRADLVLHPDQSMTLVRTLIGGVWLGGYNARGNLVWENNTLLDAETTEYDVKHSIDAEITLEPNGRALLALLRSTRGQGELTIDEIGADGTLERILRSAGPSRMSGLALMQDDFVVLGNQWDGDESREPNPELARYTRTGALVWRQTSLSRWNNDSAADFDAEYRARFDLPLLVDSAGHAWLAVHELLYGRPTDFTVMQVGTDGNVRWRGAGGSGRVAARDSSRALLELDGEGRAVFGRDQNGYRLDRFSPRDEPVKHVDQQTVLRDQTEYWEPRLLGLARDSSDRLLIATQSGLRSSPRLLIERYSDDFGQLETFVVSEAATLLLTGDWPDQDFNTLDGIRVDAQGDLLFWSQTHIGRIALP